MSYTFAGLLAGGETEWAYHATQLHYMSSIQQQGLIPSINEGLADEYAYEGKDPDSVPPMTYFEDDADFVTDYGDVVLRFPWPSDAEHAEYTWGTVGWITFKPVPPEKIEFRASESDPWRPISEWKP